MNFSTIVRALFCAILIGGLTPAQAKDYTIKIAENIEAVYAVNTTDGIAKFKGLYDATKTIKTFEVPGKITYKSGSKTYKLTVTKIGDNAFGGAECTTVVLPNTIVEIGDLAFIHIKNVNVPTKVETIGEQAYRGCSFTSVNIPATCRRISHFAFSEAKIGELTIAKGNTPLSIGQGAFCETNITSVVLPQRLSTLENRAFYSCKNLRYVTFEGPISAIPMWCFMDCSALSYVSMVNGTTEIEQSAFSGCTSLGDFYWHPSLRTICANAFKNCGLVNVNLPEGLQTIENGVFRGNSKMTYISFPSTLKSIGSECFYGCEALKDVNSLAITPPQVYVPSFPVCAPLVPITVPVNSVAAYKSAAGWNRFDYKYYSAIDDIPANEGDSEATEPQWYDLQGRRIDADRLASGIYLKVTGTKTEKVYLK